VSLRRQFFPEPVSSLYAGTLVLLLAWSVLQGTISAASGIDHALYDTYYVIVPWRFSVSLGMAVALYWLAYRLFRPVIGVDYRRGLAMAQWLTMALGLVLLLWPKIWTDWAGLPHRYVDYNEQFMWLNWVSSAGYLLSLLSFALFIICVGDGLWRRFRKSHTPPSERTCPQ